MRSEGTWEAAILQFRATQAKTAPIPTIRQNRIKMDGFVIRHVWAFSVEELKLGRKVCGQLVMDDLPDELAKKFFNIRGIQIGLAREALKQTICGTNWRLIEPDFDPRQQASPITDELGAGDEVLPAWSTHLVTLPEENRITVRGVLHHSFILSSDKVQKALGALLGLPSSTQKVNSVLEDDITNKAAELEADARKIVEELNDLFQNPKKKFPQAAAKLRRRSRFCREAGKVFAGSQKRRAA